MNLRRLNNESIKARHVSNGILNSGDKMVNEFERTFSKRIEFGSRNEEQVDSHNLLGQHIEGKKQKKSSISGHQRGSLTKLSFSHNKNYIMLNKRATASRSRSVKKMDKLLRDAKRTPLRNPRGARERASAIIDGSRHRSNIDMHNVVSASKRSKSPEGSYTYTETPDASHLRKHYSICAPIEQDP